MLFLPESPRWLMHKGRQVEAYRIWKRIRGVESIEAKEEFFVMKASVEEEEEEIRMGSAGKKFPWTDFFTCDITALKYEKTDSNQCSELPESHSLCKHHGELANVSP